MLARKGSQKWQLQICIDVRAIDFAESPMPFSRAMVQRDMSHSSGTEQSFSAEGKRMQRGRY